MKKYKIVFIDWNGVLSGSKFWWHLEDKKHPKSELFEKIETSLYGNLRHLLKPWMRGELKTEDVIKTTADEGGLDYDEVLQEFIHSCKTMQFVSEDVPSYINELRSNNVKVVIATDNMDSFSRWTVPALKLHELFDGYINSYDIKAMKGDFNEKGKSLFFYNYLKKYDLKSGEAVLIDDSEDKEGKINASGIDYEEVEPINGLVPALKNILSYF